VLALERMPVTRVVARPAALDALTSAGKALVLRTAPDEALLLPPRAELSLDDPHAIIVDDGGFAGIWLNTDAALDLLARHCEWFEPPGRPGLHQGAIANIATRLWVGESAILFLIPAPLMQDFEERVR
jgi:hypothetical protein